MIYCNDCGKFTKGIFRIDPETGQRIYECEACGSDDTEDATHCIRCGAVSREALCSNCKAEVSEIVTEAIAKVQGREFLLGTLSHNDAKEILLDYLEG